MREVKQFVTEISSALCDKVKDSEKVTSMVDLTPGNINNDSQNLATKSVKKPKDKSKSAVVLLKPKNSQNSEATEKDFKTLIDPNQVQVNRLRKGPNGGLAVVCESQVESDKLEKIAIDKLGENYIIEPQKKLLVKLKITDIGEELSEDEFICALKKQNDHVPNKEIKMINFYEVKNSKSFSAIIEVESGFILLESGFVKIMFSRCRVFEYVMMNRCYKCQGYNHKAAECKNNRACKKCAGDHDLKECGSSVFKCANCMIANKKFNLNINENHRVSSFKCVVLNKKN